MDRRSFLAGVALAPTWASLGLPALGAELDPGQRQHLDTELDTELDAWLGAQGRRAEQVSQRLGARLAGAEAAGMDPSLLAQVLATTRTTAVYSAVAHAPLAVQARPAAQQALLDACETTADLARRLWDRVEADGGAGITGQPEPALAMARAIYEGLDPQADPAARRILHGTWRGLEDEVQAHGTDAALLRLVRRVRKLDRLAGAIVAAGGSGLLELSDPRMLGEVRAGLGPAGLAGLGPAHARRLARHEVVFGMLLLGIGIALGGVAIVVGAVAAIATPQCPCGGLALLLGGVLLATLCLVPFLLIRRHRARQAVGDFLGTRRVRAHLGWQDSRILVAPGDRIRLLARRTTRVAAHADRVGPQGRGEVLVGLQAPAGALVARVSDGPAVAVGADQTLTVDRSGTLYLAVADQETARQDNHGHLRVELYRLREPEGAPP